MVNAELPGRLHDAVLAAGKGDYARTLLPGYVAGVVGALHIDHK